jgi:hypothetical protein
MSVCCGNNLLPQYEIKSPRRADLKSNFWKPKINSIFARQLAKFFKNHAAFSLSLGNPSRAFKTNLSDIDDFVESNKVNSKKKSIPILYCLDFIVWEMKIFWIEEVDEIEEKSSKDYTDVQMRSRFGKMKNLSFKYLKVLLLLVDLWIVVALALAQAQKYLSSETTFNDGI